MGTTTSFHAHKAGRQVHHKGPGSYSNVEVKTTLEDTSHLSFLGEIIVDKTAVDTDAQLTNKNLQLSESATVVTEPQLDINTKEISCSHGCTVSNIDKDKLFAKTVLSRDEFDLYMKIYDNLKLKIPKPDLIIYLQAKTETLLERIKNRGIIFEQTITENYIKKINDSYMEFFYAYKESPLLIINTSNVNINNRKDYSMLVDAINSNIKGKNFLNPSTIKAD